jgi:hypothetical protein
MGLMIEAVSTSEKSVNFYQTTRRNIPEDSHIHHVPGMFKMWAFIEEIGLLFI